MQPMAPNTQRCLTLARIGYLLTLVLVPLWQLGSGRSDDYSLTFQLLLMLPLLFPAKGVLTGRPYTHAWSGFIACLYLLWALTGWWVYPAERLLASAVVGSLMLWLIASTYFARLRGRELGLGLKRKQPAD
ncbi:DUF2069 domain-containing protein [Ferrimonas marina]|uniref:Uncharacterized membrane protein n=1 Tax=Ferrimonas marina TaxID=299255 RepID=A0A1M5RHC8_9GAMM|nr:DUF2069 domain-containing protein [Ferrimonas marina]SHH25193.1 Uncharacterized membrane protein [Ferrimonas marina]